MFACKICNYTTDIKCNYKKHLLTNKHLMKKLLKEEHQNTENLKNEPKMSQNEPKMSQKRAKNEPKKNEQFKCPNCNKIFSSKPNMRRHQLHRCKENKKIQELVKIKELKEINELKDIRKTLAVEKQKISKEISSINEDTMKIIQNKTINNSNNTINNGDTINNINNNTIHNNIILNSYGQEDLSHITAEILDKLIEGPGSMISNLMKMIHFNSSKPENMNMFIPNIRDKYIKTFKGNEWKLENKNELIPILLEKSYSILDDHYSNNESKYSNFNRKFFKIIQEGIENNDKEICKYQKELMELAILNGTKKYKDTFNIKKI